MNEIIQPAVVDTLALLSAVTGAAVTPEEAARRLREVQALHPAVQLELVWEEEAYDGSLHYDVLVRTPDALTVSISVCRDRALPWPLRGVRRWSDANLVQVNGRMLTMEDAVGLLDILWNEAPIMERMIDACLIREELERRPIEISDDELQLGIDGLRRAHRLYTAESTQRWMEERGMTHAQLERLVMGNLACARLRQRVAAGRAASYFEAHNALLATARIARIACIDIEDARRLAAHIAEDPARLLSAVQRQFLVASEWGRFELSILRRRDATDQLGAAIFAARPGDVVGPFLGREGHVIARVLSIEPARDDPATRALIEEILFDEWLAERRQRASITWHWGHAPDPTRAC